MAVLTRAYIAGTILSGASFLAYGLASWHGTDWSRYLFFTAIALIASRMKVTLSEGAGTLSMSFLFILIGIQTFSLGEILVMGCLAIVVQRMMNAKQKATVTQLLFNAGSIACSISAAYYVYHAPFQGFEAAFRILLAAATYYLTNTVSIALVIALTEQKSVWNVWRESYFWSFPNYLVGAAVAWTFDNVSSMFGWQASLLLLPVLYVIYRSHRSHVGRLEEQYLHMQELATLHRKTIETLALAIEAKDQTTRDHLARVEVYAMAIGRELKLNELELKALEAAALLHDIGKLAVPEYIISKPGKLTPQEFEKMKIHPVVGAELLEQVEFPYPVAPIVRCHHEKWDGSGYPAGIAGEDIPIGARILSAVDCLDALASDRQYRRALPLDKALEIVVKDSGKAFDPKVVAILARRAFELERMAKSSKMAQKAKLSTEIKIERGAAPGAGFEQVSENGSAGLLELHAAVANELETSNHSSAQTLLRDKLPGVLPYDALVLYRRSGETLLPEFVHGDGSELFAGLAIPIGSGLSGWVAENGKAIVNGNPSVEPGYLDDPSKVTLLSSALAVPLDSTAGIFGVLALYRREKDSFSNEEFQLAQMLCRRMGHLASSPRNRSD